MKENRNKSVSLVSRKMQMLRNQVEMKNLARSTYISTCLVQFSIIFFIVYVQEKNPMYAFLFQNDLVRR